MNDIYNVSLETVSLKYNNLWYMRIIFISKPVTRKLTDLYKVAYWLLLGISRPFGLKGWLPIYTQITERHEESTNNKESAGWSGCRNRLLITSELILYRCSKITESPMRHHNILRYKIQYGERLSNLFSNVYFLEFHFKFVSFILWILSDYRRLLMCRETLSEKDVANWFLYLKSRNKIISAQNRVNR